MSSQSHRPILLLAALVGLPCGIAGLIGLYVLTGIFNELASGFSGTTYSYSSGGCNGNHCWNHTWGTPSGDHGWLFSTCVVAVFTCAAITNVLILRTELRRRRHVSISPGSGSPGSG
jgi:hypothetical protein